MRLNTLRRLPVVVTRSARWTRVQPRGNSNLDLPATIGPNGMRQNSCGGEEKERSARSPYIWCTQTRCQQQIRLGTRPLLGHWFLDEEKAIGRPWVRLVAKSRGPEGSSDDAA